jgi:uncharacterized protein YecA (UPF0149 family)
VLLYPNLKQILNKRHKEIRKAMGEVLSLRKSVEFNPIEISEKIGRNDPCVLVVPGKKYKKCCLR